MQIDQARTRYIRWLLATRDLSPHTIRAYGGDLASFERYMGADFEVREIDQDSVISFIEQQKAAALSPASLRRRAAALRGFCRWLLSPEKVESPHRQFNGLPYYTGLFAVYGGGAPGSADAAELETALDTDLIPTLGAPTRSLLAYGALLALVSRQISIGDLEHCSLPNLDVQLRADEGLRRRRGSRRALPL